MMEMNTIQEFLAVLSSKAPVPGGGGASALAGALGNALGQMVANLTIGKKRYADVEEEICGLLKRMEGLQAEFVRLADRDAEVFAPLAQCYSLPASTPEERAYKEQVMEERLYDASQVPMEIMERAVEMMEILDILADAFIRRVVESVCLTGPVPVVHCKEPYGFIMLFESLMDTAGFPARTGEKIDDYFLFLLLHRASRCIRKTPEGASECLLERFTYIALFFASFPRL